MGKTTLNQCSALSLSRRFRMPKSGILFLTLLGWRATACGSWPMLFDCRCMGVEDGIDALDDERADIPNFRQIITIDEKMKHASAMLTNNRTSKFLRSSTSRVQGRGVASLNMKF